MNMPLIIPKKFQIDVISNELPLTKINFYAAKFMVNTSYDITSIWNFLGIINGIFIVLLFEYYGINGYVYYNDLLALIIIIGLNLKLLQPNIINKYGMIFAFIGILNFMYYMIYMGTLREVLFVLYQFRYGFWLLLFLLFYFVNFIHKYLEKSYLYTMIYTMNENEFKQK